MANIDPAVAAVRLAVERVRVQSTANDPVRILVACSGGADSLALAAALSYVAARRGWQAGLVTVDHGLQPGSAEVAERVAQWARAEGFAPVLVERISVASRGDGPEAAARGARYAALERAADQARAGRVLLGHTRDDQAETVLLALLRGAGLRGLAAMPATRRQGDVVLHRPFLDISRRETIQACAALGLTPWVDPHNSDRSFARTRARAALATLVDELGAGVVANLARTAGQAAAAAEALDRIARAELTRLEEPEPGLAAAGLADLPEAVRARVLHRWVSGLGASGSALSHRHLVALTALVTDWRGQGAVHLPGAITITRSGDRLLPGCSDDMRQL